MQDSDNDVQPGACLWREELLGPRLNSDGYIEGAPQLIVEIAVSSAFYDLHEKLNAYRPAPWPARDSANTGTWLPGVSIVSVLGITRQSGNAAKIPPSEVRTP